MYVIATALATIYFVIPFFIFFRYLQPSITLLKENSSANGSVELLIFLSFLCFIAFLAIMIALIFASMTFKDAIKLNEQELVSERRSLYGYGIFTAITFAPTILGLIAMFVFIIYTNDHILELQKEYPPIEEHKTKFPKKKLRLDKNTKTLMERLEILKEMKEQGLITEEEYLTKKKDLLEM